MNATAKSMKDLLTKEEFQLPRPGQILSGVVISVSKSNVTVDLGSVGIGIVYPGQFYDNPDRVRALRPGEEVSAILVELENEDGVVVELARIHNANTDRPKVNGYIGLGNANDNS
jgi:ribosomal protein S1